MPLMQNVIGLECLIKYLSWSILVNLRKKLCYSIVNGIIQNVETKHVNTTTIKSLILTIPKDMGVFMHLLLPKIQSKYIYFTLENANQIGRW